MSHEDRKIVTSFTLSREVLDELNEVAERTGTKRSEIVRDILKKSLKQYRKKKGAR